MKYTFHMLFFRVYHAYRNAMRPYMVEIGLASGQPKVLGYILEHEGCMQVDVAKHCDIEAPTVSRILDNLEGKGLIIRKNIEGNRRALGIYISEAGRRVYQRWQGYRCEMEKLTLAGFDDEEIIRFKDYLARAYKNLSGKELE